MKIIAIYSSARKNGFSTLGTNIAANYFENKGYNVIKYYLTDMNIKQCRGCFACRRKEGCIINDDMTKLFENIISSDFIIFSSPTYNFDVCGTFKLMFERLYPMLAGGMALNEGLKKYTYRYPPKQCMMILSMGAPRFMCHKVKKQVISNLKMNGFNNIGTIEIDGTYMKKDFVLTAKQIKKIERICQKVC